jgi:integrase
MEGYVERQVARGRQENSYETLVRFWPEELRGRRLADVTSELIEATLDAARQERGWRPATYNQYLAQLGGFLSYCYGRRWISEHPTAHGRVPKLPVDNGRERWLRTDELARLYAAADALGLATWLVPFVRFAVATGMRLSEICKLTLADLEYDEHGRAFVTVRRPKNGQPIVWPLEGEVLELVERQAARCAYSDDPLFPGPRGGSYKQTAPRHLKRAAERARIEWGCTRTGFTCHSLRRTMASLALNHGDGDGT